MVPRRRFERPTCRLGGGCSILLSYRGSISNGERLHYISQSLLRQIHRPKKQKTGPCCIFNILFSRRGPENTEVFIICRSDFSREYRQFATKVAPTNTSKSLCIHRASARVNT
jgi:hypothetical protein